MRFLPLLLATACGSRPASLDAAATRDAAAVDAIRMVLGADECAATPLLYYDAVATDRRLELVPATVHDVLATDAGLAATRTAIREACAMN